MRKDNDSQFIALLLSAMLVIMLVVLYGLFTSNEVLRKATLLEDKFETAREDYAEYHELRGDILLEMSKIMERHNSSLAKKVQAEINNADIDNNYVKPLEMMTDETFINEPLTRDEDFFFWLEVYLSTGEEVGKSVKRYESARDEYYEFVGKYKNKPALFLKGYTIVR